MTKLDNYFLIVSVDRQTFWGFQMTSNSRNTSPLIPVVLGALGLVKKYLEKYRQHQHLGSPKDHFPWNVRSHIVQSTVNQGPDNPGGGTPLYGLYRYVRCQRVWFLGCFGHK